MSDIFDFLYTDSERIASFLIQISEDGAPSTREATAKKSKGDNSSGGVKLFGLHADTAASGLSSYEVRQSYDPLWQNSRQLIERVRKNNPRSDNPKIGELRIFKGKLIAYDFSSLLGMMNSQGLEAMIATSIEESDELSHRSKKVKDKTKLDQAGVIREFLKSLPLGVGFVLVSENAHFWFNVKKDYLALNALDIPLKFPVHVSGDWNVVGVVDAEPNDHVDGLSDVIERNIDGLVPAMALHMTSLTGTLTGLFGRPLQAYGLSPLVIFRSVNNFSE